MECINATNLRRKSGQGGTQPLLPVKQGGHLRELGATNVDTQPLLPVKTPGRVGSNERCEILCPGPGDASQFHGASNG
jgi:hypothetical protein